MLHIFILTVTLAMVTAVPSRQSQEEPELVDYGGPSGILRFVDEHKDSKDHDTTPDIEEQKKIIEKTYSPAFLQPIWILDYRLTPLKGRHYKITLGNHVVILPKDTRQHGPDVHYFEDNEDHDHKQNRDEHSQEIELNRLRHLALDDKRDHKRVVDKDDENHDHKQNRNEHSQEIELNRLRHLALDDKRDQKRVVNKDDDREHVPHHGWVKGWAVLPNVKFAGRNHH